jgi:hypothetical protein
MVFCCRSIQERACICIKLRRSGNVVVQVSPLHYSPPTAARAALSACCNMRQGVLLAIAIVTRIRQRDLPWHRTTSLSLRLPAIAVLQGGGGELFFFDRQHGILYARRHVGLYVGKMTLFHRVAKPISSEQAVWSTAHAH